MIEFFLSFWYLTKDKKINSIWSTCNDGFIKSDDGESCEADRPPAPDLEWDLKSKISFWLKQNSSYLLPAVSLILYSNPNKSESRMQDTGRMNYNKKH